MPARKNLEYATIERALKRFHRRYTIDANDCWNYDHVNSKTGYAVFSYKNKSYGAHRWAYQQLVGPIPQGHDIRHQCHNRACVNPDHMLTGTRKENMMDCKLAGRHSKWLN